MIDPQTTGDTWLVAAHDAGGAEIVSAWVGQHPDRNYRFVLAGPATAIFRRRLGELSHLSDVLPEEWVREASVVLTATGYASDLEWQVRQQARRLGCPVVAFLDHWVNYRVRFERNGQLELPDEIWVADESAHLIARESFPGVRLRLEPNPYLAELQREAAQRPLESTSGRVLYVCEPISRANRMMGREAKADGYDEFDALRLFLTWAQGQSEQGAITDVRLRPHPSEETDKYDAVLADYPQVRTSRSPSTSLLEDCLWAGMVCGCSSMAMVVARSLGREVACAIPATGVACNLPIAGLTYLRGRRC